MARRVNTELTSIDLELLDRDRAVEEVRQRLVSALRATYGARQDWPTLEDALGDVLGHLRSLTEVKRKLHEILGTGNHESIVQRAEKIMTRTATLENALRRCIPLLPTEWQSEVVRTLTEEP